MTIGQQIDRDIKCPSCGSTSLNMTEDPMVKHSPENHGWYGQCHTVEVEFLCECGQLCSLRIAGYKCTAQIQVFAKGSLENIEADR
jgi:hypothetical protein